MKFTIKTVMVKGSEGRRPYIRMARVKVAPKGKKA